MKAIIWIVALVLAIPTVGLSLVIAAVIHMYLNKQERLAAAQIFVAAASSLKNDVVNKYYRLRMQEKLPSTNRTDADILEHVMKLCAIIEGALEKGGRFHNDKDDVIQLAVRLTSYAEDLDPDDFLETVNEQLASVANFGVSSTLRKPYKNKRAALEFDDDIPF